ncbi:unnamed protein product [Brassicogethes aeneus]|uniref:Uncharacterized protein n=1 Tax=Brassicogethes aeneus TaxID=1431903 RepID=A0A9P0B668_BRAAE|nr:unnamed protein product [Brassicogethes aeneus]
MDKLQRFACMGIIGAFRTTPTLAMEAILGLAPPHLFVEARAREASVRLNDWGQWTQGGGNSGHARAWTETINRDPLLTRRDAMPKTSIQAFSNRKGSSGIQTGL